MGGLIAAAELAAQIPAAQQLTPNLESNIVRPLRYRPDGEDFVITNGGEFFNRPLYGGNTAFRVDAGDQPEFVLYLPGRGGNLRLGLRSPAGTKWLHEAATIEARYRPGEMLYTIRDPLLGSGELRVAAVALAAAEGLAVRVEFHAGPNPRVVAPVELVAAYGGASGKRGRRDGDIGTESVPISEWFQLKPDDCAGNEFQLNGAGFVLRAKSHSLRGTFPAGAMLELADAGRWDACADMLATRGTREGPVVVVGTMILGLNMPVYLGIQRTDTNTATELDTYREVSAAPAAAGSATAATIIASADWPRRFAEAEEHFAALRGRVRVETPDPYLNAAVGALNVAADAVWDEPQQAIMHGAIAWRTKLLGWRGPYALDALGWTERARANFTYWAGRQNTSPIPDKLPPADAASNLARSEAALHSNGDLSNSHYDMNLVFIDALFRHLLWTGDVAFAKQMWPVIERHLAWERRLFRREFTVKGEKLPLYEAYAAIWASDDLQYSGGGTAHASAYNYWHNRMAARIALLVGADPAPYAQEAELIAEAMRKLLWMGSHVAGGADPGTNTTKSPTGVDAPGYSKTLEGHFAESKDWLGNQLVHPSAGLWSFYQVMDAALPDAAEARAMAQEIGRRAMIPIHGEGVPADLPYAMLPTTDWLPYTWSLNNVVMAENVHTALGLWQAGQPAPAGTLLKSSLLASMFMGISPGNVGSMNYLDVYRRESQRDFADGSGMLSRAVVEGLFGVRPDALAGELLVVPGWPRRWTHARMQHPLFDLSYGREGLDDRYQVASRFGRPMSLRLQVPAGAAPRITVNGLPVTARLMEGALRRYEILAPAAPEFDVRITWAADVAVDETVTLRPPGPWAPPMNSEVPPVVEHGEPVALAEYFNDRITEIFRPGKYVSPRSPFVSLALPAQGIGYWAGHVNASAEIDDSGLRATAAANGGALTLPNGVKFATPGPGDAPNILFTSQWENYPRETTVPLTGKARRIHLLMAGSTNAMQSRLDNGEVVVTYTDGSQSRLALRNPETWWPIEQDYFTDDYQFRIDAPLPARVDLKTGAVRMLDGTKSKGQGRLIAGGAATVLGLGLDEDKELKSLTVRALANDVVVGLMAATLER